MNGAVFSRNLRFIGPIKAENIPGTSKFRAWSARLTTAACKQMSTNLSTETLRNPLRGRLEPPVPTTSHGQLGIVPDLHLALHVARCPWHK